MEVVEHEKASEKNFRSVRGAGAGPDPGDPRSGRLPRRWEADPAAVSETQEDNTLGLKAIASGIAIGIAAGGGAIGMGLATAKSAEGISRQPEAENKIRTMMMLGLVFIETAIIYALLVVILIIFVL